MDLDEEDAPMVYNKLSPGGNSLSTAANYRTARYQLDTFLRTKKLKFLETVVCSEGLLAEYASYLCEYGRTKSNGEPLKGNTAYQYFNNTKTFLEKDYPDNAELKRLLSSDWFTKMAYQIRTSILRRCIQEGLPFTEKAPPMMRSDLIAFARRFLKQDTVSSLMQRAAVVINWLAVGRAGEVALMSWNSLSLPTSREYLTADWAQKKKSTFQPMSFFPDRCNYEIDYLHCLACYLITTGTTNGDKKFVFPLLQKLKYPATTLTKWLKAEDHENVEYTGTSLRVGAANEMANSRDVHLHHIVARGGWEGEALNNAFHYLLQIGEMVNVGGRALAGWTDCKKGAYLPRLVFMNDDNKGTVELYLYHLFELNANIFGDISLKNSPIIGLLHAMLASLLMYREDVFKDWGPKCHIIQRMTHAAHHSNISGLTLGAWGRDVRSDFNRRNIDNISGIDVLDQVRQLRAEVTEMRAGHAEYRARDAEFRSGVLDSLKVLTEQVQELLTFQRTKEIDRVAMSPSSRPLESSSPRKRPPSAGCVETAETEESTQAQAPQKSLNDALQQKPVLLKEFRIETFKEYYLSAFLKDYVP